MLSLKDRIRIANETNHKKNSNASLDMKKAVMETIIDGIEISNDNGQHFAIETGYSPEYKHGGAEIRSLYNVDMSLMNTAAGCCGYEGMTIDDMLFMDTETTGLAGGTGTYAFLVGIGFFQNGSFRVKQFFMRDYDEEASMLYEIMDLMKNFSCIISFNGKSFDLPLLRTRFIYNRLKMPVDSMSHLDLLHCSRRIWKDSLESCSLSSLEENILGYKRLNDIPGYMIPGMYFKYLRTGKPDSLDKIFEHNRNDIVSLLSLFKRLCEVFHSPLDNSVNHIDYFRLGYIYEQTGDMFSAEKCYLKAVNIRSPYAGVRNKAFMKLADIYKRQKRHDESVSIWRYMVKKGNCLNIYPYLELAKYYEHITGEYVKAVALTEKALQVACRVKGRQQKKLIEELKYRLNRLRSKENKPNKAGT